MPAHAPWYLWTVRHVMSLAGLLLSVSATAADDPDYRPARPAVEVDTAVLRCFAIHNRSGPLTGTVEITVTVNAQGQATAVTTPSGTKERLAAAAQCAGVRLTYVAARRDGVPVEDKLIVPVTFPNLPTVRGELRRVVDYCHAPWNAADLRLGTGDPEAKVGSVDIIARVGADGKIKEYELPAGVLPWMAAAVKCVADRLEFYPAVLRTSLVESWVVLPLDFNLTEVPHFDAEVAPPRLRSDDAAVRAAYRRCYPAGQTAMVTIQYRITIARTGRVRRAELLASSGNSSLDDAGICILRNLTFVTARRGGYAVESTLNWPILVRPPN